jgi:putative transposase
MVGEVWGNLGSHYPGVEVDSYIVMPNHLHGVILLAGDHRQAPPKLEALATDSPSALSLFSVLGRFKSFTTHEYGKGVRVHGWPPYPGRFWQHRYHDHVIRNERELNAIREYISNNPLQWELDRENPARWGSS